jgi:hypothetical protein
MRKGTHTEPQRHRDKQKIQALIYTDRAKIKVNMQSRGDLTPFFLHI